MVKLIVGKSGSVKSREVITRALTHSAAGKIVTIMTGELDRDDYEKKLIRGTVSDKIWFVYMFGHDGDKYLARLMKAPIDSVVYIDAPRVWRDEEILVIKAIANLRKLMVYVTTQANRNSDLVGVSYVDA